MAVVLPLPVWFGGLLNSSCTKRFRQEQSLRFASNATPLKGIGKESLSCRSLSRLVGFNSNEGQARPHALAFDASLWENSHCPRHTTGRRQLVSSGAIVLIGLQAFIPDYSSAAEGGGLSKYIKRKKLDPLETYVPTVILAQAQLRRVGVSLQDEAPDYMENRHQLRTGPASSLRNDMKAIAQYAANNEAASGDVAMEAITVCLSSLEDLDTRLLRARVEVNLEGQPLQIAISKAVNAIDRLLETVPNEILEKGKRIAASYLSSSPVDSTNNSKSTILEKLL